MNYAVLLRLFLGVTIQGKLYPKDKQRNELMDEFFELFDNRAEIASYDERSFIEATVREVFGNDIEVIEFEPYDDEGTTITKRGN